MIAMPKVRGNAPGSLQWVLTARKSTLMVLAASLLALSGLLDWVEGPDVSLGILYVLPILPAAVVLGRWQIVAFGIACALVRSWLMVTPSLFDASFRFLLAFVAYVATGLFISELIRNRRLALEHLEEIEKQQSLRREAEEQMRLLAESSPAAILTLDEQARILSANRSGKELFGLPEDEDPAGKSVAECLPVLADALKLEISRGHFRTAAQCRGRRFNGELFVAQTWFSTYETPFGRRLAAIAVDCSEETREREEQNLRLLLDNNRIIAGAVSHEIRNVCSAIAVVSSNLQQVSGLETNKDLQALATLVTTLEKIASVDLQAKVKQEVTPLDLREYLNHLRIVIEPAWEEIEGRVTWDVPEELPFVYADSFGLTLAFLNLSQNSQRAVLGSAQKTLHISVSATVGKAAILFEDSGPGVADPRRLFEPFQQGADGAGLGLHISRAILRSYGGELHHEPSARGCRFVAELQAVAKRGACAV